MTPRRLAATVAESRLRARARSPASRRTGPRLAAALACVAIAAAGDPARGAIPSASRILRAAAATNVAARRTQPLQVEVAVLDAEGRVAATGAAWLDPTGTSRLELTLPDGRPELHERSAAGYRVTRGGAPVARPLPLLPPTHLLQLPRADALEAALRLLGAEPERVDLAIEGTSDCWVVGGRDPGPFEANTRPSLWIDLASRQPVRIDLAGDVHYRLGPEAAHGGIRFPAWIEVEAPGWPRWRVQVGRVGPGGSAPPGEVRAPAR
jgi:hypothetical protein